MNLGLLEKMPRRGKRARLIIVSASRAMSEPAHRRPPGVSRPFAGEHALPQWLSAQSEWVHVSF